MSGSVPDCDFGNAITSRIASLPAITITSRSTPIAMPPCGRRAEAERSQQVSELLLDLGRAPARARRRPPLGAMRRGSGCCHRRPRTRSAPGRRRDAVAVSGARSSDAGAVKGWCTETHRRSSSLYSNSGGSIIQQNAPRVVGDQLEPRGQVATQAVERDVGSVRAIGDDAHEIAVARARDLEHRGDLLGRSGTSRPASAPRRRPPRPSRRARPLPAPSRRRSAGRAPCARTSPRRARRAP